MTEKEWEFAGTWRDKSLEVLQQSPEISTDEIQWLEDKEAGYMYYDGPLEGELRYKGQWCFYYWHDADDAGNRYFGVYPYDEDRKRRHLADPDNRDVFENVPLLGWFKG